MSDAPKLPGIRLDPPVRKIPMAGEVDSSQYGVIRSNASQLEIHTQASAFDTFEAAEEYALAVKNPGEYVILHQTLKVVGRYNVTSNVEKV